LQCTYIGAMQLPCLKVFNKKADVIWIYHAMSDKVTTSGIGGGTLYLCACPCDDPSTDELRGQQVA